MKTNILVIALLFSCVVNRVNGQWQKTSGPSDSAGVAASLTSMGNNIFAATSKAGVFISTDSGATWTAKNDGLVSLVISALLVNGSNIFAGTSGGLYVSADAATSWSRVTNGVSTVQINSLVSSGAKMFAGDAGGNVYFSADYGSNWSTMGSALTNAPKNALVTDGTNTFVGSYGAGVYLTTNDTSWTQKNNGLTGSALYVFALAMSGTDIFAGTGGGVFKSTDNGGTWTMYGLEEVSVQSLTISGSNIIAGTYGTGVYISSINTDNWVDINTGLTDLYVTSMTLVNSDIYAGTADSGVYKQPLANVVTSNEEINNPSGITIYPNPSNGVLRVFYQTSDAGNVKINITNMLGETVYATEVEKAGGSFYKEINLANAAKGIYFVNVSSENESIVKKIVVQ